MAVRLLMGWYRQKCSICKGPLGPQVRKEWGCDEETESSQDELPCFACNEDSPSCGECNGARVIPIHRCPKALRDPEFDQFVRIAAWSRDGGPLPAPGGTLEQSYSFMVARDIAIGEIMKVEAERRPGAES